VSWHSRQNRAFICTPTRRDPAPARYQNKELGLA
jgi:hypothetical protein